MDAIHSSNSEELDLIKNENIAMDQALKSMTSFLKVRLFTCVILFIYMCYYTMNLFLFSSL